MEKQSLLVVTSYPPKGKIHDSRVLGIASYTKSTLVSLKKIFPDLEITVLSENFLAKEENYQEEGITIKRVWKRNSFFTFLAILQEIITYHNQEKNILISFGFSVYGNLRSLIILPFFLCSLKLLRKNVYFISHEVVDDVNEIHGHINISKSSPLSTLYNGVFKVFYWVVLSTATKVIVFEEMLKERLTRLGKNNVAVIPIAIEKHVNVPNKSQARSALHISQDSFVVLVFGFLAWYKGTDWIVKEVVENKQKNIQFIIAGGANPNRVNKPYYQKYIEEIQKQCKESGIILTGFIPEEDLSLYFQAADIVLFPYRAFMGASASLALSLSFQKPFLLSERLKGIFRTDDINKLIDAFKINSNELVFPLDKKFIEHLETFRNNKALQKKLPKLLDSLVRIRSWDRIGRNYYDELFS